MKQETILNSAIEAHRLGEYEKSELLYRKFLRTNPANHSANNNLGLLLLASNRAGDAAEVFKKLAKMFPQDKYALINLGNCYVHQEMYDLALESYQQSVKNFPAFEIAWNNYANCLKDMGRYEESLAAYNKALELMPEYAQAHYNVGVAYYELRQYQAAVASYDNAIALKPDHAEAYFNRGLALHELGQFAIAIESYSKAISIKPLFVDAYVNRGAAFKELKRLGEAIESFKSAIALEPNHEFLLGKIIDAKRQICDWSELENQSKLLEGKVARGEKVAYPFIVLSITSSLGLQRQAADVFWKSQSPSSHLLPEIQKYSGHDKIRIGYFSADFHNHATMHLMAELFERHDKNKFELVAISFGPPFNDDMRKRVVATFDRFVDVTDRSDTDVAQLSRDLEIDIAVDLKGFTQDCRSGIFAARAAPIQVSYLGYPGTMGAEYIDYLIADPVLIPEDKQQYYSEKIVYLPNSYQVNDNHRQVSEKMYSRTELGLPQTGFVFCCFNNTYKISPETFNGWMRILKQVENSVLWLFIDSPLAADNLRKEAEQCGVDAARLIFAERMPLPEHLARLKSADLFLDTLPYNAHTTTSDALWVGLPVLTRSGEAFASRVAASLLSAIELPELITSTQEEYEALAIELANNQIMLRGIREKLARNRHTTALFNTALFTKHIESSYIAMYENYHSAMPLKNIYIA